MGTGKKKIEMKKIEKESQRLVTFSKRRKGLFKKASELHSKTGASVAVLAISPSGRPYPHGDPSFESTLDQYLRAGGGGGEIDEGSRLWMGWVELIEVEDCVDMEELCLLKKTLEEIREKFVQKFEH